MSVYSLVYSSAAKLNGDNEAVGAVVDNILATARRRNAQIGVTGALLFTEGRFVQALEGDRDTVRATFDRIVGDPRHSDVEVLASQFGDRHRFKEWSMAYVGNNEALRSQFSASPLAALGSHPAGDALLDFMLELARNSDGSEAEQ